MAWQKGVTRPETRPDQLEGVPLARIYIAGIANRSVECLFVKGARNAQLNSNQLRSLRT